MTQLTPKSHLLTKYTVDKRIKHVLKMWGRGGGNLPPSSDTLLTHQIQVTPPLAGTENLFLVMQESSVNWQIFTQKLEMFAPHLAKLTPVGGELASHQILNIKRSLLDSMIIILCLKSKDY